MPKPLTSQGLGSEGVPLTLVGGIGVDIIEIARLERIWRRYGRRLVDRLYTPGEQQYCLGRAHPAASLAARFAAKEAVMKAMGLGAGRCRWRDIEVVRGPAGAPAINLSGAAARRAAELGFTSWHLSLSHCRAYAVAHAVAERGRQR